jgi:hypothetical protein
VTSPIRHTRGPDDLAAPGLMPDDCFMWDDESECSIQSDRARATAISNFAFEWGCRFEDVVCRRRFMRRMTRQESYNARALDEAADTAAWDWAEKHGFNFRDGAFRDTEGNAHEPPEFDDTVPADWEPGEQDPVWGFCEKTTPDAIPCWRLESKS